MGLQVVFGVEKRYSCLENSNKNKKYLFKNKIFYNVSPFSKCYLNETVTVCFTNFLCVFTTYLFELDLNCAKLRNG